MLDNVTECASINIVTSQNGAFFSGDLPTECEQFCQQLRELGIWPENADRLFMLLSHSLPRPLTPQERNLVSQVAQEAVEQVDIAQRHPCFFRDMLMNATLRMAFGEDVARLRQGQHLYVAA